MSVRTRFAPSPTGYLHIGGARTALFSWLHARKHGGSFILRIEDTDLERSTPESVDAILEGMAWLGLDYDEGPFYQTHRFDHYREVIQTLLDTGHAYRCYCSKERLEKLREDQMIRKEKPRYDGHCRHLTRSPSTDAPYVIRFRNPEQGEVVFEDQIRGVVRFNNAELDDLIIARTDGVPTYNLTVVVDDADMQITHVIRGDDHLNNTPRQVNILRALGFESPAYAHVPMILGPDGKRLSKRHGAVSVMQYRDDGYLPEALINYLVRLGWSHGDQEIFSLDEMIELFDIKTVNRAASSFNPEKLLWLNQHYIKTGKAAHIGRYLSHHLGELGIDPSPPPILEKVIESQQERSKTLVEMAKNSMFFYCDFENFDEKAAKKNFKAEDREILQRLRERFESLTDWSPENIHDVVTATAESFDQKMGKVAQPLRVAISGGAVSPPIDVTVHLVGRERCLQRIDKALTYIEALAQNA